MKKTVMMPVEIKIIQCQGYWEWRLVVKWDGQFVATLRSGAQLTEESAQAVAGAKLDEIAAQYEEVKP